MAKISTVDFEGAGRLKATEPVVRGRTQDDVGASQARILSTGQSRWEQLPIRNVSYRDVQVTVPVLGSDPVKTQTHPLMPCHPARARQLLKKGAKKRWFKGLFVIKCNRVDGERQPIVCGIDSGSKREAFTLQSEHHTYLNVLSDAVCHVSERVQERRDHRRGRRRKKAPCRSPRSNRYPQKNWLPPSIISRWEAKYRIVTFLKRLYPITSYVIEDVAARKYPKKRRWNKAFSNLEMGKTLYYKKFSELGNLKLVKGYDTSGYRECLGLEKSQSKLSEEFSSHNVDSWVLASMVTGKTDIDNKNVFRMISHNFYRRKLHYLCPSKNGVRFRFGSTISGGFKKGSVVKHPVYGLLYVGGFSKNGITLHNISTKEAERHYDNPDEYTFLYYSGWVTRWVNDIKIVPKKKFIGGHSLRDPNVRAKGCETKQALYGDPNFTNREKAKETCLEKYGVENIAHIPGVIDKRKATLLERYGKLFNWERKDIYTKEELIKLHHEQGLSLKEIGDLRGVTSVSVSYWMQKHGVTVHKKIVVPKTKEFTSSKEVVKEYLETCFEKGEVLSFINYGKITEDRKNQKMKRLFNAGKPYNHLREELSTVALDKTLWDAFILKIND